MDQLWMARKNEFALSVRLRTRMTNRAVDQIQQIADR